MKPFLVTLTIVTLFCLGATSAQANLIVNGSFETPVVPVGSFTNFGSGSTGITGWTVVGPEASIVSGTFSQNGLNFPAQDGVQWVDLTGFNANSVEGVQQVVSTTPGTTYNLSYFVGNVVNPGGIFGLTSTVDVLVNGSQIQAATNSGGGTTLTWEQFTTSFVATGSSTTIGFLNGDPRTDNSNGLDNVVLTAGAVSGVPEPGTWVLLGSGLGGIAAWRKYRSA